jgi:hypothetical protein
VFHWFKVQNAIRLNIYMSSVSWGPREIRLNKMEGVFQETPNRGAKKLGGDINTS